MQAPPLHGHGTVCWLDLLTPDPAAAADFYGALLGWTSETTSTPDGLYTMFQLDGQPEAGAAQLPDDAPAPPHWSIVFATDDLDATVERATTLGATVLREPRTVMDLGREATIMDPGGAAVGLWQAHSFPGSAHPHGAPGTLAWPELATWDVDASASFYTDLFGLTVMRRDMGPPSGIYTSLMKGETAVGGVLAMTSEWGEMPSHWSAYWSVADIDAAIATIKEHGGAVKFGPMHIPNVGSFAVATDPQGAHFYPMQLEPMP